MKIPFAVWLDFPLSPLRKFSTEISNILKDQIERPKGSGKCQHHSKTLRNRKYTKFPMSLGTQNIFELGLGEKLEHFEVFGTGFRANPLGFLQYRH